MVWIYCIIHSKSSRVRFDPERIPWCQTHFGGSDPTRKPGQIDPESEYTQTEINNGTHNVSLTNRTKLIQNLPKGKQNMEAPLEIHFWLRFRVSLTQIPENSVWPRNGSGPMRPFPGQIWLGFLGSQKISCQSLPQIPQLLEGRHDIVPILHAILCVSIETIIASQTQMGFSGSNLTRWG